MVFNFFITNKAPMSTPPQSKKLGQEVLFPLPKALLEKNRHPLGGCHGHEFSISRNL